MHLIRSETSRKLPIPRKGTIYVAKPKSYVYEGVSVIVAVRDILHIARTAREVNQMVHEKMLKLNGRTVRHAHESIKLLNILEAGKKYVLTLLPTGRFSFEETKATSRIAKVVGKKILRGKVMQINLHDGTNVLSKEKIVVGDSLELDFENTVKKILPLEKGKEAFIESGRSIGLTGKITGREGRKVTIQLKDGEVVLDQEHLIVQ